MSLISQMASDIAVFLADFGESQTWTPAAGGAATAFTGIFDNEYFDLSPEGIQIAGAKPALIVETSAVAGIAAGDTVTVTAALFSISGTAYTLHQKLDAPADLGPGFSRLILKA